MDGSIAPKCLSPKGVQALPGRGLVGMGAGHTEETAGQILHVPGTLSQGLVTSDQCASDGPSPESHWTESCP